MVGYLKSHRHSRTDRQILVRMARHKELMDELVAEGLDRDEASKQALAKLIAEEKAGGQ